jgi:hypothetical protein
MPENSKKNPPRQLRFHVLLGVSNGMYLEYMVDAITAKGD